jgi:hypothetical protein
MMFQEESTMLGRICLGLIDTDITKYAYIQSWMATEIIVQEKCGFLAIPHTVPI